MSRGPVILCAHLRLPLGITKGYQSVPPGRTHRGCASLSTSVRNAAESRSTCAPLARRRPTASSDKAKDVGRFCRYSRNFGSATASKFTTTTVNSIAGSPGAGVLSQAPRICFEARAQLPLGDHVLKCCDRSGRIAIHRYAHRLGEQRDRPRAIGKLVVVEIRRVLRVDDDDGNASPPADLESGAESRIVHEPLQVFDDSEKREIVRQAAVHQMNVWTCAAVFEQQRPVETGRPVDCRSAEPPAISTARTSTAAAGTRRFRRGCSA